MEALDRSTETFSPATLRLVEEPRELREAERSARAERSRQRASEPDAPQPPRPPHERRVPESLRVPVCVILSLGAHALMTVVMPSEAALQPVAPHHELTFLSLDEVMLDPATEPALPVPAVTPPEPPPAARDSEPVPVAAVTPPEPASDPAPSAPPPAAAEVLAATNVAAGGPAFTSGTAGGTAHGLGSTPTASETNPAATRPSEGTGTAVDVRGLMRGYMATLNGRVRPEVRYPRAAQIAGLEGTVMIGLLIDERGTILRRRVKRSSGHASLDAAALEGAERVASVPAPPSELRTHWSGGPQEITVPIRMTIVR